MASVVIFIGIFDFSTKGMAGGIGGECDLSDDRLLELTGGWGCFEKVDTKFGEVCPFSTVRFFSVRRVFVASCGQSLCRQAGT